MKRLLIILALICVLAWVAWAADQSAVVLWSGNTSGTPGTITTVTFGFLSKSVEVEDTDSTDLLQVSLDGGTTWETLNAGDRWYVNPLARRSVKLKSSAATVAYEVRAGKAE